MENRTINLEVVAEVAKALGHLNKSVVFVGGAVVSVYADDDAGDDVRPTQDVDLTLTLLNFDQQDLDTELSDLGIHLDMEGHAICSYRYKGIAIDIMPASDTIHGFANRWYQVGFDSLLTLEIEEIPVQVLSAPCYLATKFEAFNDRGQNDYRTSHDFEDIVFVIDNRATIVHETTEANQSIRNFLSEEANKILNNPYANEILSAHLHPLIIDDRYPLLEEKLKALAAIST